MPTPNQKSVHSPSFHKLFNDIQEPDLAHEILELRQEIAALRAELAPVPSLIITGKFVLDEFKKMTRV